MCLIAVAWRSHPRFRLALIANRDEFHARPTLPAAGDGGQVFGGRDVEKGGSWLLASTGGRLAAVTNVRVGPAPETAMRSRGILTREFVTAETSVGEHLEHLATDASEYGRFNLLLGSADALHYASNHPHYRHLRLPPGVHALSNGDLDAPWPKAERVRQSLSDWLAADASRRGTPELSPLFEALADRRPAADEALPDTGVGMALERFLSSPFIVGQDYGTRASTVLLIDDEHAMLCERRFGRGGIFQGETHLSFPVPPRRPSSQL